MVDISRAHYKLKEYIVKLWRRMSLSLIIEGIHLCVEDWRRRWWWKFSTWRPVLTKVRRSKWWQLYLSFWWHQHHFQLKLWHQKTHQSRILYAKKHKKKHVNYWFFDTKLKNWHLHVVHVTNTGMNRWCQWWSMRVHCTMRKL